VASEVAEGTIVAVISMVIVVAAVAIISGTGPARLSWSSKQTISLPPTT
jgi:hypothetical protein